MQGGRSLTREVDVQVQNYEKAQPWAFGILLRATSIRFLTCNDCDFKSGAWLPLAMVAIIPQTTSWKNRKITNSFGTSGKLIVRGLGR